MKYKKVATTKEVFREICAAHKNLSVFSSYSNPDGSAHHGSGRCEMLTEFGFKGYDYPLIGAKTTWDKSDTSCERINERHKYWFCVPVEED